MSSDKRSAIELHSNKGVFFIVYEGTLRQLGQGAFYDIATPFTADELQYPRYGSGDPLSTGDATKADIHKIAVVSVENTFGTDVVFNLHERRKSDADQIIRGTQSYQSVKEAAPKRSTDPCRRGLLVIKNNTRMTHNFPADLFISNEAAFSDGNHVLGAFDIDEIEKEYDTHQRITKAGEEDRIIVNPESKLYEIYSTHRNNATIVPAGEREGVISLATFDKLKDKWRATHTKNVTKVNMLDMVGRIAPGGRTWGEYEAKIRRESPATAETRLDTVGEIVIGLEISYILGGHYDPFNTSSPSSNRPSSSSSANRNDEELDSDTDNSSSSSDEDSSSSSSSSDDSD